MKKQGGGFALGLIAGVLIGLALALGVALYITKVPVPFVDKVPQRTPEQDTQEAERNKHWDPNAPLAPASASRPSMPASAPMGIASSPPGSDPAAILSGSSTPLSTATGADPFIYFVQVGAYRRAEDAEAQRAQLAMQGMTARITERDQAGRTVYRVRLGPIDSRAEAENMQQRVRGVGLDGQLVRVQRP